jgi:hypothetical protein
VAAAPVAWRLGETGTFRLHDRTARP